MDRMIAFAAGLFVGAMVAIFIMALVTAADQREGDDE